MRKANRVLTVIAVLLVVALVSSDAWATGCKVAVRRNVAVQQVILQKQVVAAVATVAVPAIVAVPQYQQYQQLYGATYQPDGFVEAFKLLLQQNQALIGQTATLNEQLRYQGLGGRTPGVAPMPGADPGPAPAPMGGTDPDAEIVQLFSASGCATCHDQSVSKKAGGGFTLMSGSKLANLTPDDNAKILQNVASGKMPKKTPMTAEQRLKFVEVLTK